MPAAKPIGHLPQKAVGVHLVFLLYRSEWNALLCLSTRA
jgi:hypothetical protein